MYFVIYVEINMIIVEIKCDNCDKDISETINYIDYRLHLSDQRISAKDGPVTSMLIYPNLKRDCHFCNLRCLKEWINNL